MSDNIPNSSNLQQDVDFLLISFFEFMENLGDKQKRIVWTFHDLYFKYDHIFISQEKLASVIPCCRKHINRTVALLAENGYLKKRRRRRMSNVYHLCEILKRKDLKQLWAERHSQSGEVTSKVTSRNCLEDPPDMTLDGINHRPPYIPHLSTGITEEGNPLIKEIFLDFDWSEIDKIQLSRASDDAINYALEQVGNFLEAGNNMRSSFRFIRAKIRDFNEGKIYKKPEIPSYIKCLGFSEKDSLTFLKYSLSDIITGRERVLFCEREEGKISDNRPARMHKIIQNYQKKESL